MKLIFKQVIFHRLSERLELAMTVENKSPACLMPSTYEPGQWGNWGGGLGGGADRVAAVV